MPKHVKAMRRLLEETRRHKTTAMTSCFRQKGPSIGRGWVSPTLVGPVWQD